MADATASLKLGLIDDGFVAGVSNASTQLTNLQLASTAVSAALPLLEKGLRANATQYLLGSKNAELLATNLGKIVNSNKELGSLLGKASNVAFYAQQLSLLAKGASDAYATLNRIPQALEQMNRSGVSTDSIQGFMTLRDAISGSQVAVESFAQVAVAKLNAVESASARVGTILKSSTEFTESGTARRATATDLNKNRKQIQKLLRDKLDNTVTTTDALLGQYEVLSGGFTSEKTSQQVLESGSKLIGIAGAGGQAVDPTATLQLLTKTLRAYGLEASQANRVSAILNGTVENGITTIQELSQTFGQASQVAKTAGISIEDLAAATAVLTAQGTSTPVALTGIQALARSIIDKTPEAAKEIAKLRDKEGNRIRFDIREVQQKGLAKSVQDIFEATGGDQTKLAQILPDTLAYRTALGLNSNKGQDFTNVTANIKANANVTSLDEVFKGATDDKISRFQKIANRFEETIIQLGESLAPVFEPGLAYLEQASKLVANIPDPIKKAIGAYLSFQIQTKTVGLAFKQLSGAVISVLGNFALLRVINLVITGQLGKQAAVIKDLILQKKGLGAVVKQLLGLDQSRLLVTKEATDAIVKEGVIQKTVNAAREQTNNIIKKNIKGFVDQTEVVKNSGVVINSTKGKFAEFVEAIKGTTVGKKIEEITGKFSGQKAAIQELTKKTQEYFNTLKNTAGEGIEKIKSPQPSEMDRQVEAYAAKRRAEIEKNIPDSPDSFGEMLEVDPEAKRETRRRELLAERERRNKIRRQQRLDSLIPDTEGKTFGESFGIDLPFGDFAEIENREAKNKRRQLLEDIRTRRAARDAGVASVASNAVGDGLSFGDFLSGGGDAPRVDRDSLRDRAAGRGFGNLNRTRERSAIASRAIASQVSLFESLKSVSGSAFSAIGKGVKSSFGLIIELAGGAITALGPIVPLGLAIGAAFALAGKEIIHIFGGGTANKISKGIDEITKALKELEKESGKDGALLEFKANLVALSESNTGNADALDPLKNKLNELKEAGNLTSGQFATMSKAMQKAGEDGKVTAQELSILQNQIEAFRAGAPGEIEKGIGDRIGEIFSLEGLGKATNFIGNLNAAVITTLYNPQKGITTVAEANANREGDRLIKMQSKLRNEILDPVGDKTVETIKQTKALNAGLFQTEEARKLASKGSQIQGVVLEKENKETNDLIKANELLISGYQSQQKERQKLLDETTDTGLKQQLNDQFDAAQSQIDNLQKRTEALKQAREQITKYYNETLPVLQQAVVASSVNPLEGNNALDDAFSVFKEKYIDEGKVFLKDVQQQRTEGQAVLDQILQNYDRNLLKSGDVANKVKDVLDKSFITLTKDGKQIKGSIFDIDTQKNLISQIAQFSSQATAERISQIELESSTAVTAGQLRQATEEDVIKKTSGLQQEKLGLQKKQLESEIELRLQYGIKVTDLENQLKQTNLEIAQAEFNEREKLIQKRLERQIQAMETEKTLISAQVAERGLSEENAQTKMAGLQIKESKLRADELKRQLDQFKANGVKNVELENEYAQARNQIRGAEAKEKERLIQQELQEKIKSLDIEQLAVEVGLSERTTSEKSAQNAISKYRIDQEKLKLAELDRQLEELKSNGSKSVSLEQETAIARSRIRKMEADEKNRVEDLDFETQKKQLENENQRAGLRRQALESEYDLLQKQAQLVEAITSSRNQLADTESRYVQSQLQNQAKLTRDPLKQAEIELRIIKEREVDLVRTQKAELESLATRQKLADLDLKRQVFQIQSQKLEAESQAQILKFELERATKQKRSPEEIEAIKLQIQGNKQRTESLTQQLNLTGQQINQQGEINKNEQKRVRLTQQIESENAKIEKKLAKQKLIQEQIDKATKPFVLSQQQIQQGYDKQTAALEKQNTIFSFQKQLIEAKQRAISDRLGIVTSELGLASQLIVNDKQRQVLAQATATIKLKALDQQQKAEREVLLLNQQQAKVQQQIDAIKLKGQQAQNKAEVAQAQADLAKLEASGATPEEIVAGQMNLEAKLMAGQGLALQASLLPLQSQLLDFSQQQEIMSLDQKQKLDRMQAKSELANTLPEGRQKAQLKQSIINEALSDVFGKNVTDWNYTSVLDQIQRGNQADLNKLITGKDRRAMPRNMGYVYTDYGKAPEVQGLNVPSDHEDRTSMRQRSGSVYIDYGKAPEVQGLNVPSDRLDEILKKIQSLSDPIPPDLRMGTPSAPSLSIGQTEYTRFQQYAQNVENNVKMEVGGIKITVTSPGDVGKDLEQEMLNTFDRIMVEAKRRM
jgi:hypothetical protein